LDQADSCTGTGEIGALLRREGLFASHLSKWRKLRDQGALGGTASPRRGRKPDPATPLYRRAKELEQENETLRRKLRQAEIIIEVQKKVSEILDISLGSTEERS
jgi:transposase-like protein